MKNETKSYLIKLCNAVICFEHKMDKIMKMPPSYQKGIMIAELMNELTIENQSALHFCLGYSFKKIEKMYSKKNKVRLF